MRGATGEPRHEDVESCDCWQLLHHVWRGRNWSHHQRWLRRCKDRELRRDCLRHVCAHVCAYVFVDGVLGNNMCLCGIGTRST
eukprot:702678-Amphidinium_carterae.1